MARDSRPIREGRLRADGALHWVAAVRRRQRRLHRASGFAQYQAGEKRWVMIGDIQFAWF